MQLDGNAIASGGFPDSFRLTARRRFVGAMILGSAFLASACSSNGDGGVEADVQSRYRQFPSAAQPEGVPPWPAGRFTGECRPASLSSESYACLYSDAKGRRGFACVKAITGLLIETASGPYDQREWTDHAGRRRPPEAIC